MMNQGFARVGIFLALIAIFIPISVWGLFHLTYQRADATSIRNGVRQLRLLAEETYDKSGATYERWSTSPLVEDDVELLIENINSSLGNAEDRAVGVVIIDSRQREYCISAPIDDDKHYCIDAAGIFVETSQPCRQPLDEEDPLSCPATR